MQYDFMLRQITMRYITDDINNYFKQLGRGLNNYELSYVGL